MQKILNNMRHIMRTVIYTTVCKQTQFNEETKTIANEDARKRNSKACCAEQNAKTKIK